MSLRRAAPWLRRYGPAELVAIVGAVVGYAVAEAVTSSAAAAAYGAAVGDNVAYYGLLLAREVAMRAFDAGLVIETAGPDDGVLKLMPPLTISVDELTFGLDVIETAIDAAASATGYLREAA